MSTDYRFNFMHFMPYTHLPENHRDHGSLWVDFPNEHFDPKTGHALYQRYLAELLLADKLGFDAVVVNEHHATAYSMMPSPSIIAAALIPQLKEARICVWGTPPNLVYPNRLAEEYAMLDVLSQGRLEVAFPLGTGMEYWVNPINPTIARERQKESIKIILQGWKEKGPTSFYGDHYTYRYLNPWPRPYQESHPACYIAGSGSPETIELAAEFGFGYAVVFVTRKKAATLYNQLRERSAFHGTAMRPEQTPLQVFTYVAETDEKAEAEFASHLEFYFNDGLRSTPRFNFPPGYLSVDQYKQRLGQPSYKGMTFELAQQNFFVACGSAEKVTNLLGEWGELVGSNHFNLLAAPGDMPHWKVVKNLSFIAEEVMPHLRPSRPATTKTFAF